MKTQKSKEAHKRWVVNNLEKYKATTNRCKKEWALAHPEKMKEYRRKYTISKYGREPQPRIKKAKKPDIYVYLFDKQNGICAICGSPPSDKRLAVDHCHTTGKIRGLLCSSCNCALGLFKDNTELLDRAAGYLKT